MLSFLAFSLQAGDERIGATHPSTSPEGGDHVTALRVSFQAVPSRGAAFLAVSCTNFSYGPAASEIPIQRDSSQISDGVQY